MINKVMVLKNKIIFTVKYLFKKLVHSPILLGWIIIIGTIIEFIRSGYHGFINTIINLILLGLFTVIIKIMTDISPVKLIPKIKHQRLELLSGIILYIFLFTEISILWKVVNIPFISPGITNMISSIEENIFKLGKIGILEWILPTLANALIAIILHTSNTIFGIIFIG